MRILWAFLVISAATTTCAATWAAGFQGLDWWGALFSTLVGVLLASITFRTCQSGESDRRSVSKMEWILLLVFAIASFRCFFWVLYPVQNFLRVLSPYNLGDLSMHIQLIRTCALGTPFWPESPLLSGIPLVYPLGMDLLNAVVLLLGADLLHSLVWVGCMGAVLTAWALWRWGSGFALAAFLFAGGFSGFSYLMRGQLDFLQKHIDWKNLFLSMLVTQRGLLYALPAGLALLYEWRRELGKPDGGRVPIWVQASIYATLPLFNVHTFLFLSLVLVCCFLYSREARKRILALTLMSVIPATICLWNVSGGFSAGVDFRFLPGWLQGAYPWKFWWNNFGILPILWIILLFLPSIYRDPSTRGIFLAATLTFLFCCFFSITPWAWDNTKLMIWAYLAVAPLLWKYLLSPLPFLLRSGLCILLFFSGAVALLGGLKSPGYPLISLPELRDVQASLVSIPPFSRFACATDYNHPIALSGRKRVAGYEGHLWSHGLPYKPVWAKLERLMNGENDWRSLARDLGADFIFWGPREEARYPQSKKPWLTQTPRVIQGTYGIIFDLRPGLYVP